MNNLMLLVVVVALYLSVCSNLNPKIDKNNKGLDSARINVLNDFAESYKTPEKYLEKRDGKPFNVFVVYTEESTKDNLFVFSISPRINKPNYTIEHELGKTPEDNFPTMFKVIDKKLYYWIDRSYPLETEMLDILKEYEMLDSTDIKYQLGILPENFDSTRVYTIDDELEGYDYYVCKNQIEKFIKKVTNIAFGYYEPPKIKCG